MNLSKAAKATRLSNAVAAGTTVINGSSINMQGYNAAEFTFAFGAITATAVTSCKVQGSIDDATWFDLDGSTVAVADTDGNQLVIIDVVSPLHQYLRPVVSRGTANAVLDAITCRQYQADREPVTHDAATVVSSSFVHA